MLMIKNGKIMTSIKLPLILLYLFSLGLFADDRPNIILILVDDMGYSDLGAFGSEIETPNLDRLSKNGLTFTHFTNCAKCETTRTTLMSGRYHTELRRGAAATVTIPENLALAGYQNFMVGKWHIFNTPMDRGFERYFGFHEGASNFFTGEGTKGGNSYHLDRKPFKMPENFYSTTAFTDYAIKYVKERKKDKPFFMYVAHNAPHYPLQAPKKDVMKYRGKYKEGWEILRQKRFKRMKELKIIPEHSKLAPWKMRKWDSLSAAEQDDMDLRMATYAAMIDIVDQNVGRLVDTLKEEKILANTLIVFLSDNGACPFDRTRQPTLDNKYMPWDKRSYYCYPEEWAAACNTPFREFKQSQFEGGIATSMIAHWPKGITVPGTFNRQRGHLIDFHATFRELAKVKYPAEYKGKATGKVRGISLLPSFTGKERPKHEFLYQNFRNQKTALVIGDWKLVNKKLLFNLKEDRTEINDLSESNPEKFKFMLAEWEKRDKELNGSKGKKKPGKKKK